MTFMHSGAFDKRGEEQPFPSPIPGHEPEPDEPEPDEETHDLVRPIQT